MATQMPVYIDVAQNENLCEETGIDTEVAPVASARVTPRKVFSVGAKVYGILAGVACVYMVATMKDQPTQKRATVRSLLDGPEFTAVATDNVMKLGSEGLSEGDRDDVHRAVTKHLKDMTQKMEASNPAAFRKLSERTVTHEQRTAIMQVVASMNDPRVQEIGSQIHEATEEGRAEGREGVKRNLIAAVTPRLDEMRVLRDEIIPAVLRKDKASEEVTFDPEKMHALKDLDAEEREAASAERRRLPVIGAGVVTTVPTAVPTAAPTETPVPTPAPPTPAPTPMPANIAGIKFTPEAYSKIMNSFGVIGGILEQARVVLDQVDAIGEDVGSDEGIPYWLKSMVGMLSFADNMFDCSMRAQSNGTANPVKVFMCPLKYSSSLMDGLHGILNVAHVNNDEMVFTTTASLPAGITVPPIIPVAVPLLTTASPFTWMDPNGAQAAAVPR